MSQQTSEPRPAAEVDGSRYEIEHKLGEGGTGAVLPARIGARYDVVDRLGRGGMAVVYRVRDRSSPIAASELALKQLLLPGSAQDQELRALFEREFHVLAQLKHPSAVEVYDFGVDAAGSYYTMELLDRGDLSSGTRWPLAEACQLMMQVCSLLSLLHARGFVHRDLTPRNVRLSALGAAKLIDFGAMVPFGPCLQAVGTPGFVAPEVVHHLALDARTDLFSLGATLYYVLTGERAFPARSLAELNEVWRRPPKPPSELVPGIPPALDELVSALLQLDPQHRPKNAFEVMQRLAALSGRPLADSAEIARAYLSTPVLVGRDSEQRRFRSALARALRGEGGALIFEGASGSGRSRLLDACVLAAKTSGATVVRGSGRAARREPLSCAHALAEQLLDALPDDARSCAENLAVADSLFLAADGGRARQLRPLSAWAADAERVQAAWLPWFTRVARAHTLLIVLDDLERIDASSLGLVASLASEAAEARMLVLGGLQAPLSAAAPQGLALLRRYGSVVALPPLSAEDTHALFNSVFAGAPHVALLSARTHAFSAGNPRAAMALSQYLLDRRLIRYADGSWILPAALPLSELPASLEDALRMQLTALPPLARRLAEAHALALEGPWSASDYRAYAGAEAARTDDALAALLRQGVIAESAGSYTLAHPGVRASLLQPLTAAERDAHQRALGAFCVHTGRHGFVEAYHLLQCEAAEPGLARLEEMLEQIPNIVELHVQLGIESRVVVTTLERARTLSIQAGRGPREVSSLERKLMALSVVPTDDALYQEHAPALLRQLELDSGLADYRASDPGLPAAERLQRALERAMQRYASTPEPERVYPLDQAIKQLAMYVSVSILVAERRQDMRLLASLPGLLEPFAVLSPVLYALWQNALNAIDTMYVGRFEQARVRGIEIHRRLESVSAQDVPYLDALRYVVAGSVALMEVLLAHPSAERWIGALEHGSVHRGGALRLRRLQAAYDRDLATATRLQKQSEAVMAQASSPQPLSDMPLSELALQMHLGDLAGVKQVVDRVTELAARWPGWRATHELAQGVFHRMRGDQQAALAYFQRALAASDPERSDPPVAYTVWVQAAEGCMSTLADVGRLEEARALGDAAQARSAALEMTSNPKLLRELAVVEARLGLHQRAAARLDALIERHVGRRAWWTSLDFEARARVAILAKDARSAAHFIQLALHEPAADGGARQLALRGRLLEEARRVGLSLELPRSAFESALLEEPPPSALPPALSAELEAALAADCDAPTRAARALELLRRALGAESGQLYFARESGLERGAGAADPGLDRFAQGYWQQRALHEAMSTVFTEATSNLGVGTWTGPNGKQYSLLPLSPRGEKACIGLATLVVRTRQVPAEYWALSAAISGRLVALGDVPAAGEG